MPRDRTRVTLDAGTRLSLEGLRLIPGAKHNITWRIGDLETSGSIYLLDDKGVMRIRYEGREQQISLVAQPCHFGGVRWLMKCPLTGKRVSVLWRPPGAETFGSRHAFGNASYWTQSVSPLDRAWRKKRKIALRLGSKDPADCRMPPRPRWMRNTTYRKLAERHMGAHHSIMRLADERFLGKSPG
jgi:hypothetical protein